MSKLSEMIATLCPNGVEYKKLGEIGDFYSGLSGKSKDDFKDGNAKFITYMNVYSNPSLKIDVDDRVKIGKGEKQNIVEYGDILFTGSSETPDECGMTAVLTQRTDEPLYLNSFCFGFRLRDKTLFEPDFLKHLFRSAELRRQIKHTANGVTRFNVSKAKMAKVVVPLPPLPIQREIAKILDNLANLTAELMANLTAEIAKREKQYKHYRDMLLNFTGGGINDKFGDESGSPHIEWKRLGELLNEGSVNMSRGDYITKKDAMPGTIPVILGGQEPAYFIDRSNHTGKAIVISRSGASAGFVSYWDEPIFVTDGFAFDSDESRVNSRYLFYWLKNAQAEINGMKKGGGVPHITGDNLKGLFLPIPHLAEQKRIVAILDRFDSLCNSLTEGLPAEIALRKKKYEYYRDKLLSFKEAS